MISTVNTTKVISIIYTTKDYSKQIINVLAKNHMRQVERTILTVVDEDSHAFKRDAVSAVHLGACANTPIHPEHDTAHRRDCNCRQTGVWARSATASVD